MCDNSCGRYRQIPRAAEMDKKKQRAADWKTCGRERQRVAESGRLEDMWKRAEESGRVGHKTSSIIFLGKTRKFGTHRIMQKR